MIVTALFLRALNWKQPKCSSTGERMNKFWYINTQEYYSAIKMNYLLIYTQHG